MRAYLDDILFWVGAGLVTLGAWLVYVPAGFVCAGLFCLVFSVALSRSMVAPKVVRNVAQIGDEDNGA